MMWMQQALNLAEKGRYTTRPNPAVGCVIVRDNQIVGEGYHQQAGEPHAEIVALRQAGELAKGATVYVTLEPCAHQGRTGPCAKALVEAQVAKVVVAMLDPNPKVNGQGVAILRDAGIEVEIGEGEAQARQLNQGFIQSMQGRPFVRAKIAMSADGKTASAEGKPIWITGKAARLDGQKLRAQSGAIITGIGTVLIDDPLLTVRTEEWDPNNVPEAPIPHPIRVVVDSKGRLPLDCQLVQSAKTIPTWLVCTAIDASHQQALEQAGVRVEVMAAEKGQVDLAALLNWLHQQNLHDIMLEAGATLTNAFLQQQLLDELWVYQSSDVLDTTGVKELNPFVGKVRLTEKVGQDTKQVVQLRS